MNFVTGSGNKIGSTIVSSKDVAGIVFTGSRKIGYGMAKEFSKVKSRQVIAEMGGKNPAIVTESADINKAVEGILKAAFGYSGQKCSACSRVYIQKSIKNKFIERLVKKTKNLSVGNPLKSNTFIGPLIIQKLIRAIKNMLNLLIEMATYC